MSIDIEEGYQAIIATERAEVLKLREQNRKLREALEDSDRILQMMIHHNGFTYPKHRFRAEKQVEANATALAEGETE